MYETFKKLKFNQIVLITSSDCMNSTPTERAYKVGRRTHSKRYNLEKLTLIPYRFKDVKKPDPRCKHYLKELGSPNPDYPSCESSPVR